jgi:predicted TIM-barrel fold metal-dependent hydrolase
MNEATGPREAIIEPELPIVDAHHHLWDLSAAFAALPPPKHGFARALRRAPRYLFDELLADMKSGHNVKATVFIECHSMYRSTGPDEFKPVGETEFANGVAAMSASGTFGDVRACAGIVGAADLRLGARVAEVLEAHMAASSRFRGIRQSAPHDPDPDVLGPLALFEGGLYRRDDFREGFARLAPLGLSFDAWLLEPQLPDLIDLARAFPETAIVLDHLGTPLSIASYAGKREERFPIWRDNIRELAKSPKVFVKLGGQANVFSGFPSFMSDPPAPSSQLAAEWKPYIETCIDAFGPPRCMFESNFPVDIGSCDYDVLWNAFKRIAARYSADEKASLFSDAASNFYRLKL